MVIFHFEEAGDWNRACCHSNNKMCTIYATRGRHRVAKFTSFSFVFSHINFLQLAFANFIIAFSVQQVGSY